MTLYPGQRFSELLDNAHNLPLQLAVELGLPVALAVCGGGALAAWRAKPWRERNATRQLAWAVIAVIMLHSLLEYPLWYGPFQMALGLSLWLLWRQPPPDAGGFKVNQAAGPVQHAWPAMLLIAVCGLAAWDYQRVSQIYLPPAQRLAAYQANTHEKIKNSWFFQKQVGFAVLTTTPLSLANAQAVHDLALAQLHFSPEPRVVEPLIQSADLLGHGDEAAFYRARYRAAFPANLQP